MKPSAPLPETFLHFIWENRLFYTGNQQTVNGEPLEILRTGTKNSHAGPDFFNARVKIGKTVWAGNVEIHKKASDWGRHNHGSDKSYENVILHVVEKADKSLFRENGTEISTFEMSWPRRYTQNFQEMLEARTWIPCQKNLYRIDPMVLRLGFHRLMIERLERKTCEIENRMKETNNNWNEAFYQMLARMLGFRVNALPFELLAKAVPLRILFRHKNSFFQLEALLFGASGLLHEALLGDDFFLQLREEYSFFHQKYAIKPVESHLWKFMRLRPVNFPTIRISQLAGLIYQTSGLFSKAMEAETLPDLKGLFHVKASPYWESHYRFNKPAARSQPKELGDLSVNTLIINVVVPFLFVYGEHQEKPRLKDRALAFLEQLPPEKNAVTRKWSSLGVKPWSAFDTQALLWLKKSYCDQKKCLNCPIGSKLVKLADESDK